MRLSFYPLLVAVIANLFMLSGFAGPEPISSGKEMTQVAPAPEIMCNWTGFYIGGHAGGQFGDSETTDFDYNFTIPPAIEWSYDESGFVGGGQVGYNFQWRWLVLGFEGDGGYMNLEGDGAEPNTDGALRAETDSDFYMTARGRVGFALDCWLFYATGGGIGVNYTTRFADIDPSFGGVIDARRTDFNWGYTVGGGIERMIGRRWSIKAEYLYFNLDEQRFHGTAGGFASPFETETWGHIVRAGLNFHF